ncbi:MAG: hypothetical protein Q4D52_04770 [Eubacteriales bacterium]|nr:hypothetical protein [Eubacteriales bacterium]
MKKSLCYLSTFIILTCLSSGCRILSGNDKDARPAGFVSEQPPSKEEIALTNTALAGLAEIAPPKYKNLSEAGVDSDMVIRGKVVGLDYISDESGSIHTREFIEVLEVLSGEAQVGDVIEARVDGGYILISEYLNACNEDKAETARLLFFREVSEEDYEKKYYSKYIDGEKLAIVGDESIYLLKVDSRVNTDQDSKFYVRTDGPMGEYFLCHDGQYLVPDYVHSPDLIRRVINGEETKDYEGYTKISYEELLTRLGVGN